MTSLLTEQQLEQVATFSSPGSLLKAARQAQGMTPREVADALNLIPGYVRLLEEDNYQGLANPDFARGYIRNYGRLLDIAPEQILPLYDELVAQSPAPSKARVETRPLQLQATGVGIVVGLVTLVVVVALLWLWQDAQPPVEQAVNPGASIVAQPVPAQLIPAQLIPVEVGLHRAAERSP